MRNLTLNPIIKQIIRPINNNQQYNNRLSLPHKVPNKPQPQINLKDSLSRLVIQERIITNKFIKIIKGQNKKVKITPANLHNLFRRLNRVLTNHNKDSRILLIMLMIRYLNNSQSK